MSFTREYTVKAVRKAHRCDGCRQMIAVGTPAARWVGLTDGDFGALIWHPECRAAEIALNSLRDTRWYDEWSGLDSLEPDDHEWLRAEHPVVADRMGILVAAHPSHPDSGERQA